MSQSRVATHHVLLSLREGKSFVRCRICHIPLAEREEYKAKRRTLHAMEPHFRRVRSPLMMRVKVALCVKILRLG
jgi:hypothetical protein